MAGQTLILPSSTTARTELLALPRSGGWLGQVAVRVTTHTADATINSWEFINQARNDSKVVYRRTAYPAGSTNNWYNFTLKKEQETCFWMMDFESLFKLTYTSSYPIAVGFETTRSIRAVGAPEPPATAWNKQADASPWVTNTAANNPTELLIPDGSRNALGVVYWRPR